MRRYPRICIGKLRRAGLVAFVAAAMAFTASGLATAASQQDSSSISELRSSALGATYQDWEDNELTSPDGFAHIETVGGEMTFDPTEHRTGKRSLKVVVNGGGDSSNPTRESERAELAGLTDDATPETQEFYSWSTKFADDWRSPSKWGILWQVHGPNDWNGIDPDFNPSVAVNVGDTFSVHINSGDAISGKTGYAAIPLHLDKDSGVKVQPGIWYDLVLRVKWSGANDGEVDLYMRTANEASFVKRVSLAGIPTMLVTDGKIQDHYAKLGFYRNGSSFMNTLWNDNFSRTRSLEQAMATWNSSAATSPSSTTLTPPTSSVTRSSSVPNTTKQTRASTAPRTPRTTAALPAPLPSREATATPQPTLATTLPSREATVTPQPTLATTLPSREATVTPQPTLATTLPTSVNKTVSDNTRAPSLPLQSTAPTRTSVTSSPRSGSAHTTASTTTTLAARTAKNTPMNTTVRAPNARAESVHTAKKKALASTGSNARRNVVLASTLLIAGLEIFLVRQILRKNFVLQRTRNILCDRFCSCSHCLQS